MALNNPFTITYGDQSVGGTSDTYLLNGPHALGRTFEGINIGFDVVVVATSHKTLAELSLALEAAFAKRDQSLTIDVDSLANPGISVWEFTFGETILNTTATATKSGNPELDQGFSRSYACTITGELPPSDTTTGLRDVTWSVIYEASQRKLVTMAGSYTATADGDALSRFLHASGADAEAATFLTALDATASFERVDQQITVDRNNHTCDFTRQYVELLANQAEGSLDDTEIRDHDIKFTEVSSHPGDSMDNVYRLREVVGSYTCSIDIDETTNMHSVFETKVKPHIRALFVRDFTPQVFALRDKRVTYDETAKRMSVQLSFVYQSANGEPVVEVTSSLTTKEMNNLDYTATHNSDPFAAFVDVGFAVRTRTSQRNVVVVGEETPKRRIGTSKSEEEGGGEVPAFAAMLPNESPAAATEQGGLPGGFAGLNGNGVGGGGTWMVLENTSQASTVFLGDPEDPQITLTTLVETVVERYHTRPKARQPTNFGTK